MSQDSSNLPKSRILFNALNKQHRWYTGIPIKKYIQKNIFATDPNFYNKSITSSRWSAYCHYSPLKSIQNLLEKNQVNERSTILAHPLLSKNIINQLQKNNCHITSTDIDKNSLNFDTKELQHIIQKNKPDLILNYSPLGLYSDLIDQTKLCEQFLIPHISFIPDPTITLDLMNLFESTNLGGVIINAGFSFADNHLNEVLDIKLTNKKWYISWQIEQRTKSILEYHLQQSHQQYSQIIEAYYYLLLKKQPRILNQLLPRIAGSTFMKHKFDTVQDAMATLIEQYTNIQNQAVPDIFFDLENHHPSTLSKLSYSQLQDLDSYLHHQTKQLHNFMSKEVERQPKGTLEIPKFFQDKTYLSFAFFTTNHNLWNRYFEDLNLTYRQQIEQHISIKNLNLNNVNFVYNYMAKLDIVEILTKNLQF
ncbi:hypothetical protein HC766_05275 [Candidatus Gracilibacteria bacterium]|nr:hypothetical protein [Candidatus Gracilibacteria bacterium]NJS41722.1 hypothetical protein [Candidatus Gracilibacteria bacterium]